MTDIRDAGELLWPAVATTLAHINPGPEHEAIAKLAERYARVIDGTRDQAWAARWLMPLLLDCLAELGATPAARARLAKGGKQADAAEDPLSKLRARRRGA